MSFAENIYEELQKVPKGKITTYKLLANAVGSKAYRAVGQALKINPFAPTVPCHRVVASNGTIGGFMGEKVGSTIDKKIKMLESEGIRFKKNKVVDFKNVLFVFGRN